MNAPLKKKSSNPNFTESGTLTPTVVGGGERMGAGIERRGEKKRNRGEKIRLRRNGQGAGIERGTRGHRRREKGKMPT